MKNRGFSLIEVVLALAILILGLIGVVTLFPVGLRASRQARFLNSAALLAQKQLEEVKILGYKNLKVAEGEENGLKWKVVFEEIILEGVQDASKLRKAIMTIRWNQGGAERKSVFVTVVE